MATSWTMRSERPDDAAAISAVNVSAFPTDQEARLVESLRAAGDLVLSLVAERNGDMIGQIGFPRLMIDADGARYKAVGLAPVCVHPRLQAQGVGSSLISKGLEILVRNGESLIFVLGEPEFYGRFGFDRATAAGFACDYSGPYFLARRLSNAAPTHGRVHYPNAFAALT